MQVPWYHVLYIYKTNTLSLTQAQPHAHALFGFLNRIKFSLLKSGPFLGALLFPYFFRKESG